MTQPHHRADDSAGASEERRWRLVNRTMRLHDHKPHALIETLHSLQESFGYLETDALRRVAGQLKVPLSRVYAVATFYHHFQLKPAGAHVCVVCLGTACYIKGSAAILEGLAECEHIVPGQTTADGKVSLLTARCLGACGLAPAGVLDGEVTGNLTLETLTRCWKRWTADDADH
jgi:bidirectional [NiFe] hydrogenase diaphorase subunit